MTAKPSIFLQVTAPNGEPGLIKGFRYLWAFYVKGYKPDRHCQPCFIGQRAAYFSTSTELSGRRLEFDRMDRFPYLYVCGVGTGPKSDLWKKNCHLPLRHVEGAVEEATTYNGYPFRIENAVRVPIPELPENWQGKPREHTRCKNFQFAVAAFGFPPKVAERNTP